MVIEYIFGLVRVYIFFLVSILVKKFYFTRNSAQTQDERILFKKKNKIKFSCIGKIPY